MVEKLEIIAKEMPEIKSLEEKRKFILSKDLGSYSKRSLTVADDWCDCDCYACNDGCYMCE